MGFLKKKQEEKKPEPVTATEDLNVSKTGSTTPKETELTLEEVISTHSESWYKAQLIELLVGIHAELRTLREEVEKNNK